MGKKTTKTDKITGRKQTNKKRIQGQQGARLKLRKVWKAKTWKQKLYKAQTMTEILHHMSTQAQT